MPIFFERAFRVRHYECDAYGHVNHANYVRYMQETAFDASAAVGYALADYEAMGRFWLVRETDVTYLQPLRYGDTVIVKTWVSDFRRVRSRRMYELRLAATDQLVATAHTEWIYLDAATRRPTTIPPEMIAAFLPVDEDGTGQRRDKFPEPPSPPPGVFSMRLKVNWRDLDSAGHVNNAMYLAYLEDCGIQILADRGWSMDRMQTHGFGMFARRYRIEYRQEALLDDEVEVATWVSDVKRATAVRHYTITRISDGVVLARARAVWVWVNLINGRPIRIPAEFMAAFQDNVSREAEHSLSS
ncbi:MAG: acyl-CoA thioesterase [Anaerolineales bacterium]|nr:acyl-CoA thioesterase [Anaerolineales bacterium]